MSARLISHRQDWMDVWVLCTLHCGPFVGLSFRVWNDMSCRNVEYQLTSRAELGAATRPRARGQSLPSPGVYRAIGTWLAVISKGGVGGYIPVIPFFLLYSSGVGGWFGSRNTRSVTRVHLRGLLLLSKKEPRRATEAAGAEALAPGRSPPLIPRPIHPLVHPEVRTEICAALTNRKPDLIIPALTGWREELLRERGLGELSHC